jgi:hypothetical protein
MMGMRLCIRIFHGQRNRVIGSSKEFQAGQACKVDLGVRITVTLVSNQYY